MKKTLSLLMSLTLILCSIFSINIITTAKTTHTQSEAVSWAKNLVGSSVDYDNQYGAQCVDLIACYYEYLGTITPGGNASKYATNKLPSGWQRINYYTGFIPKPGDIAVWTYMTSSNGHVAIITSADSNGMLVVDQNGTSGDYDKNGTYVSAGIVKEDRYSYSTGTFSCVIRPDFDKTPPTISNIKISDIGNSKYKVTCTVTDNTAVDSVIFVTKNADGQVINTSTKHSPANGNTYSYLFSNVPKYGYYTTSMVATDSSGNVSETKYAAKVYLNCKVSTPKIRYKNVINGKNISLSTTTSNTTIYYKTSKNGEYKKYTKPFKIKKTTTVYAKAKRNGWKNSNVSTKKFTISKLKRPKAKATAKSSVAIRITWNKVPKAEGYYIYRATSKNGTYKKVKTINNSSTTKWTNSELKASKYYYYKVRAFSKGKASSDYSKRVSAKTKKSHWKSAAVNAIYNLPKFGLCLIDTYTEFELVDLNYDNVPEIVLGAVGRCYSKVGKIYYYNGEKYVKANFTSSENAEYPIYPAKDSNGSSVLMSYDFPSEKSVRQSFDMILNDGYNSAWLYEDSYSTAYKLKNHKVTYNCLIDLRPYVIDAANGDRSAENKYINRMNDFNKSYQVNKSKKYIDVFVPVSTPDGITLYDCETESEELNVFHKIMPRAKAQTIVNKYIDGVHHYAID